MSQGCETSIYLPPFDVIKLRMNEFDKAIDDDQIPVPLDEFGVPRPMELMRNIMATIDDSYTPPEGENIHHTAYSRSNYWDYPSDPHKVAARYREGHALMLSMPTQIHNYAHAVMEMPPIPVYDVMRQRVIEQKQVDRLSRLGMRAVKYVQWSESDIDRAKQNRHGYKDLMRMSRIHTAMADASMREFYEYLKQTEDGQVGLMPDRDVLAKLEFPVAVEYLGTLSDVQTIDVQAIRERNAIDLELAA